jgi:hypothetical protein
LEKTLPRDKTIIDLLEENPFDGDLEKLVLLKKKNLKPGPRDRHLGVTDQTIRMWQINDSRSTPTSDAESLRHFVHVLDLIANHFPSAEEIKKTALELRGMVSEYIIALTNDDVGLYACGKCLNMGPLEVQKTIDTIIHDETPLLTHAYYSDRQSGARAEDYLDTFAGLYVVWMKRVDEFGAEFWIQCSMHVRYIITINGNEIIRAKLLIPDLSKYQTNEWQNGDPGKPWDYDGFFRVLPPKIYLVFEKRDAYRQDFIFFVANQGGNVIDGATTYSGEYLTSGQDKDQSTVSGVFYLRKMEKLPRNDVKKENSQRDLMPSLTKRLNNEDPEYKLVTNADNIYNTAPN